MSKQGWRPPGADLRCAVNAILDASSDEHVRAEKIGITVRQLIGLLKEHDPHRVVVMAQNEWDMPGDFQTLDKNTPVTVMHYNAVTEDVGAVDDSSGVDEDHYVPALVLYPKEAR